MLIDGATMANIIFHDLHSVHLEKFVHDLDSEQTINLLGGNYIGWIANNADTLLINTVGNNTYEGANSYNFRDNKIETVDYARSNYNIFF
jgi:hypothetical protein